MRAADVTGKTPVLSGLLRFRGICDARARNRANRTGNGGGMWSTLTDNALAGIAALTALAGLAGAWIKLKPKPRQVIYRLAGFLSAAKEREILQKSAADWQTRAENEANWKDYWKAQAQQCIEQFQREYRADAQIEDRPTGSHGGGGHASSRREDGPTQQERLTG